MVKFILKFNLVVLLIFSTLTFVEASTYTSSYKTVKNTSSGPFTTYYMSSPTANYARNSSLLAPQIVPSGANVIYNLSGNGTSVYYPNTGYYRNTYYPASVTTTTSYTTPTVRYVPAGSAIRTTGSGMIINQYSGKPLNGINLLNSGGRTTLNKSISW